MIRASVALAVLLGAVAGCSATGDSGPPVWRRPGPAAEGPLERRIVPDDGFTAHLAANQAEQQGVPDTGPLHRAG